MLTIINNLSLKEYLNFLESNPNTFSIKLGFNNPHKEYRQLWKVDFNKHKFISGYNDNTIPLNCQFRPIRNYLKGWGAIDIAALKFFYIGYFIDINEKKLILETYNKIKPEVVISSYPPDVLFKFKYDEKCRLLTNIFDYSNHKPKYWFYPNNKSNIFNFNNITKFIGVNRYFKLDKL